LSAQVKKELIVKVQQMTPELSQQCIEAYRRARTGRRAATGSARGSAINRESAQQGSIVNLQENQTVNTQQQTHARLAESFKRLGYSDESAERAAAGRDNEVVGVGDVLPTSVRESLNIIRSEHDILPGAIVAHHPIDGGDLREAIAFTAEREERDASQARLAGQFERMGMSPAAARIAARGR